jgi:acrylyl-CoA reductase (NADPH)
MTFRALRIKESDNGSISEVVTLDDADLGEGDVTVRIEYSTINYKDGFAITQGAPIVQTFPLTAGIDFAGTVEASDNGAYAVGDQVVLNGWGLSQTHDGGLAEKARVPADWLIKLPQGIDTRHAAAIGTAGYTAMLSVLALEHGGITPESGDILVTGANGGVGSVAIALLSKLGYRVVASTGRHEEAGYLKSLGAAEIIDRGTLSEPGGPIGAERWAGAIDSVGSHTLANVLAQTRYGGVVTNCGLAQGMDLPGSCLPFLMRGVTLSGIDSVQAPRAKRIEAWDRLARDLDLAKLDAMIVEIGLAQAPEVAGQILQGKVRGRTLVDVHG